MFESENFYKLSGRVNFVSIVMSLLIGTIAAIPLSIGAAYAARYVPIIYLAILIVIGYVFLVWKAYEFGSKMGDNRNRLSTIVATTIMASIALYFAWVSFIVVLSAKISFANYIELATTPGVVWEDINYLIETGWFSFKGSTVKGTLYAVCLACEAIIYFGFFWFIAPLAKNSVYCENCQTWLSKNVNFSSLLDLNVSAKLVETGSTGEFNCIDEIVLAKEYPGVRLEHVHCIDCLDPLYLLTAREVRIVTDENGAVSEKENKTFFNNLKIDKATLENMNQHLEALNEKAQKEAEEAEEKAEAEATEKLEAENQEENNV